MFWAIILATFLFFVALIFRSAYPNVCAICFAMSGTWVVGLLLYFTGSNIFAVEPTLLALLMGGSAVGLMYYLSSKLPEKYHVYKLPYLLTVLAFLYYLLDFSVEFISLIALALIWIFFVLLFIFRDTNSKKFFQKIIECCKNW